MENFVLYLFLMLLAALIGKFVYMFIDVFGDDGPRKRVPYVHNIPVEGPSESARRWLNYHKKAIIGHRILNDVTIPDDEKTDIDIGIDHAQSILNAGGPCEIVMTSNNAFNVHVANEIMLILTKKVNREIDFNRSKMFESKNGEHKSTIFIK